MLIGRNLQNLWYIHTAGRAAAGGDQPEEVSLQTAQLPEAVKEGVVMWALMWAGCAQMGYYEFSCGCHWISQLSCSCAPHLLRVEVSKL